MLSGLAGRSGRSGEGEMMRNIRTTARGATLVGAVALVATVTGVTTGTATAQEEPEVVAEGLNNPRHVTISPNGKIYVAESGAGGDEVCDFDHQLGTFSIGFSGSVARIGADGSVDRVVEGLPSIINQDGETLGPSDIAFKGSKDFVLSIGIGGSDVFRESCPDGELLGTLVTGRVGKDSVNLFADVLAYEAAANPGGEDIDSNPVGVLRRGGSYVVADAGGNAIVRASHKGVFSTVTAVPRAPAPPPFNDADPVPTSVVRGPDGAFYFSQLTGFPFTPGVANIWRVVPGSAPTVYASGLTNVTDLAFARDGSLYAVEIASEGLLSGPIGSLVKIAPGGGSTHETVAGGLFAPYGVALTKHAAYVTTGAVLVGGGELIKIALD
jgi:sugar lactone lactonase YvrE